MPEIYYFKLRLLNFVYISLKRNSLKSQGSHNSVNDSHLDDDLKFILNRENSADPSEIFSTDSSLLGSSRPTSSSLSKYTALPKIGAKLETSQEVVLGMRLPNGKKLQSTFLSSNKVEKVLDFAFNELKKENSMIKKTNFTLLKWPNVVINDLSKTIEFHKIETKSMLLVIEKRALTVNLKNH